MGNLWVPYQKKGGIVLWGNTLGNDWIPSANYKGKYPDAMINVEIQYEKE
jgi:hypothetical protein